MAAPSQAQAAEETAARAEAARLVNEGNILLEAKAFAGALEKYEAARRAYPSPKILFNIGEAHRELGHGPEAADAYAAFLESAAVAADAPLAVKATEQLEALDAELGRLKISGVEGAEVTLDGKALARATDTHRVAPGHHEVRATRPGFVPFSTELDIGLGQEATVDVTLARVAAAPHPVAPTKHVAPAPEPASGTPWWLWVAIGGAVAAGTVVAVVAATSGGDDRTPTGELPESSTAQWIRF